jgi:CDP-6-deoxy-D-xylo-4-hexulose-3-dehydrase
MPDNKTIKLTEDTITNEHIDRLIKWLSDYPKLTQGDVVKTFENEFAKYIGTKHAVFVNSGSSANLLMTYAMKLVHNIEKIVIPTVSWATDLAPAIQLGLKPILVDCNAHDLSVDLLALEEIFAKESPDALLLVSILGLVPDMDQVIFLCEQYNVQIIEDNCESLGSRHNNKMLGTFGCMSSFSFYYSHHISTIEGGMIVTDDDLLHTALLMLRSHGWGRDLPNETRKFLQTQEEVDDFKELFTFYVPGFNLRGTDLQAFIGLCQLEILDNIVNIRNNNYVRYCNSMRGQMWIPFTDDSRFVSNFGIPVMCQDIQAVSKLLSDKGIESRPLICGSLGLQPVWKEYNGRCTNFPQADFVNKHGIYIPNHSNITDDDVDYMCNVLKGLK